MAVSIHNANSKLHKFQTQQHVYLSVFPQHQIQQKYRIASPPYLPTADLHSPNSKSNIKFAKFLSILIYHLLLKSPNTQTQDFNQTVQYLNSLLANLRLYKIPMTAIVLALFYMHRLHSVAPEITITKGSEGLLFAIALMVACKYHCDETYRMR